MDSFICPNCRVSYPILANQYLCPHCGSSLEMEQTPPLDRSAIAGGDFSLWRYARTLPLNDRDHIVTMGEGWTPLQAMRRGDDRVRVKLEYANPTGSYKDRGASVMVSKLLEAGVEEVVEDSSGNAGAALAAYCSRAGIRCNIFVPASHSQGKMRQIQAYGANLIAVEGSRQDTALAAMEAGKQTYYASHAHSPLFVEGCKTMAYELWEQMGQTVPAVVFTPLGQGSILLGLYKGFRELVDQGLADKIPRLVGVQAEACAPLALAYERGLPRAVIVTFAGQTRAEGIKITDPVRDTAILMAVRETGGAAVAVTEEEIEQARKELALCGYYVEPTSAVTLAGYHQMEHEGKIEGTAVLILTGSGLKSAD